jgi:hypothetical protein
LKVDKDKSNEINDYIIAVNLEEHEQKIFNGLTWNMGERSNVNPKYI